MKNFRNYIIIFLVIGVLSLVACGGDDAAQQDGEGEQQEQVTQPSSNTVVQVVQPGQLEPVAEGAQPSGWDTDESIRGGLRLVATYDSSGPDAWDVDEHPLVYMTSEGTESANPGNDENAPYFVGFHIVDAYSKEVVASFLLEEGIMGGDNTRFPHGFVTSPDGKWGYLGWGEETPEGEDFFPIAIINMRTLKLDKVVSMDRQNGWDITGRRAEFGTDAKPLHHVQAFTDYAGNDRVILQMGFGARGGPHYILDPNDDNRVWKSITYDEIHPLGHPFTTPSPDGKYIYFSMGASHIQSAHTPQAGIAKLDLETGEVIIIKDVGNHPIGITHTADGKYTYTVDGHGSHVYKIDNETNEVVASTSAGVAGPYGIALNWDETELFIVGKGESSHNSGGHLGMIDTKTFRQSRILHRMPIDLGGSASSVDHAILHPDPDVNELWVSNMNGWETIVLDLDTHEPTDWIATPNGGNTHSGCFVKYNADWSGELMADQGGPKSAAMWELVSEHVAASAGQ